MQDTTAILDALRHALGAKAVLTGADTAPWARDWTGGYTADPLAVVRPASTADVSATLQIAHAHGTPVVPVSGNTGLTGGTSGAGMILLSLDRMSAIRAVDPAGRTATVEAGVILSALHDAAADHDLIFPLTFGARGSARIGGVLSTNAGGSNVLRYGNTRDLVLGIEVVLADGRVMDLMTALHKDNSGYHLRNLMIGAEGTLGIITAAVLKLFPAPRATAAAMVAARSLPDALEVLHHLQEETGGGVQAFEYMPRSYIDRHQQVLPKARPPFERTYDHNIFLEIGATAAAEAEIRDDGQTPLQTRVESVLAAHLETGALLDATLARSEAQRAEMWARREAAAEITFHVRPFVDTDIAVPLPRVQDFLTEAKQRLDTLDPGATDLVVAHLGDGNIHYTAYPTRDDPDLKEAIREMVEDIVEDLRGSFSAEHGVGVSKRGTMARRKDPAALDVMRAIKGALDPKGILNPGKVLPDPPG